MIAEKLCEGAERIASSHAFFFMVSGKQFELIHTTDSISLHESQMAGNKTIFDLKGAFINIAVENRQPIYMADMKKLPRFSAAFQHRKYTLHFCHTLDL